MERIEAVDILDLTKEEAMEEATRCLNCKKPLCVQGCPINNNIPQFIQAVKNDDMPLAYKLLKEKTNLPTVCGKLCPHEKQCEGSCVVGIKKTPVRIGRIENFIANYSFENDIVDNSTSDEKLGNVAIIGSGPAGLSCASILAEEGFSVTIYEKEQKPGGVLTYGIPRFRISAKNIEREIKRVKDLGVKFKLNKQLGKDFTIDDLKNQNYDAIFVATGANMPKSTNIPGEDLEDVMHANRFLLNCAKALHNEIKEEDIKVSKDDTIVIIGAGNVAMDTARTAKRISDNVTVVYRRTKEEMPASKAEYEEVVREGIPFMWRCSPLEFMSKDGKLCGLKIKNLETDEESIIPCTKALTAIGSNSIVADKNIELNDAKFIKVSEEPYGMTNIEGVFAAGDVVNGPKTIVVAMREGRKTAYSIKDYILAKK